MCCQFHTRVSMYKSSHNYMLVALPKQTAFSNGNNTPRTLIRVTSDEYFCKMPKKLHSAASGHDPPTR